MSTETKEELDRISGNVADTYSVLEQFGAEMPQVRNTANLPETAAGIKAVLCIEQQLPEAQQMQARKNIGVPDTEEIVQQVISALGTPVFGTVDGENNIILTGNLADGTYILKYEDAEGNLTEIGTVTVGGIIDESGDIAITWGVGVKLDKNSGAEGSGAQYAASQSIPYDSSYTYTIATTNDFHVQAAICWYDASGGYLGWNDALTASSSPGANRSAVLAPKGSAASFRIRAYSIHSTDPERVNSLNRVSLRKDLNK